MKPRHSAAPRFGESNGVYDIQKPRHSAAARFGEINGVYDIQ